MRAEESLLEFWFCGGSENLAMTKKGSEGKKGKQGKWEGRKERKKIKLQSYVVYVMCYCIRLYIRVFWCPSILQKSGELSHELHSC